MGISHLMRALKHFHIALPVTSKFHALDNEC